MSNRIMRAESALDAECELLASAVQDYCERNGRISPTLGEILVVLKRLGYRKPDADRETPEGLSVVDRPCYLVRIDGDCEPERADRIAVTIESLGGLSAGGTTPEFFAFPTASSRDAALEAIRRTFGWTVVHSV